MYRAITKYIGAFTVIALFLIAAPVQAARLDTIGNEANTATLNVEYTFSGIAGAPDGPSTTQKHGGADSFYFGQTGTAAFSWVAYKYRSAATAASTTVRAYVYINSTFSNYTEIFTLANEGPGAVYAMTLNASNQLCVTDATPTQVGSCTAISTGTWHYVELSVNGASTVIGRLDGVQFTSSVAATGGAISRVYFGCAFVAACKSDMYFDDEAINDSTGSSQTSWPGAGTDIRLSPNAAGDANTFATQTGGTAGSANNFSRVLEVTPDGATTFNGSATLNQQDLYNVTDSGIGASDTVTLVEYHDWFRASVASAEATFTPQIEKAAAGTIAAGTAIVPNSITFKSNANANPNLPPLTLYNDPDGSAWTKTTLDSMQIGGKITTGSTNRFDLSTVWVYVETNPVVTPLTNTIGRSVCSFRFVFVRYLFCR